MSKVTDTPAPMTASQIAKSGYQSEADIAEKFNAWKTDEEAQKWLAAMGYNLGAIESVNSFRFGAQGYKADSHFYPYEAVILLADSVHCQDVLITGNLWPYEPAVKRTVPNGPTDVDNWILKHCMRDVNGNEVLHYYSIEEYVQLFEFHLDPIFWNYVYKFLQYKEMDYPLGEKLFEVELKDEEELEAARQYVDQPPLRPIVGPQAGTIGFWQLLNGRFVDKKKEELPVGVWSKWYRGY